MGLHRIDCVLVLLYFFLVDLVITLDLYDELWVGFRGCCTCLFGFRCYCLIVCFGGLLFTSCLVLGFCGWVCVVLLVSLDCYFVWWLFSWLLWVCLLPICGLVRLLVVLREI